MRDYHFDEAKVVMQELIEDVASRVPSKKKSGKNDTFAFWL